MEIIDAFWEKRNLGTDAFEIILNEEDCQDQESIINLLQEKRFEHSYTLVKLPSAQISLLHKLEALGFNFMESLVTSYVKASDYKSPNFALPLIEKFKYLRLENDSEVVDKLIQDMPKGLYTTDRFYLDPFYGAEISHKRYTNWFKDLQKNPSAYFYIAEKISTNEVVGLLTFTYTKETRTTSPCLAHIMPKYQNSGVGVIMTDLLIKAAQDVDALHVYSCISSNNSAKLKINARMGMHFDSLIYCLRRLPQSS